MTATWSGAEQVVNAIRDGEPVTVTYHFWGGDSVTYTVAKNGTTMSGTAS
ncbi:hypothetical protein O1R50_01520 [Glycomyces luteolus]|uniref:Endoglucanase B carbohydrate binding domain-containing protein n=1 Tax=Glycomyces luteolus TaxID=2670330 RepID=A0A9X3P4R6_9ACTN|nr:hypothetical protein [Glycomyces luteolus]MDA1358282.1 hypothetical protein [Glycomyces luteolus]